MTFSGLKATFDEAAELYASVRPGYPAELIQAVIDISGLPGGGRILEIGCGTGQATVPFADRGYPMLCLEPGPNLAAFAQERFKAFSNVAIEAVTFEDWPLQESAFDLILSAQAFHWIAPEVGYPKAAQALKPGGTLALFWNLTVEESAPVQPESEATELTELSEAIQSQYARYAPELLHTQRPNPLETQVAMLESSLISRSDLFHDIQVMRFPWSERYDAARYAALLSTYSGHIALPDRQRHLLLAGITRAIQEQGNGFLLKRYVAVLFLARRK